jgi:phosphoribosylformylglycinamidine synthase
MIHEIRINLHRSFQSRATDLIKETKKLGFNAVNDIKIVKVFRVEGCTQAQAEELTTALLYEPFAASYALNKPLIQSAQKVVEIAYKPGVMNPEIGSLLKAAQDLEIFINNADSSYEYHFFGDLSDNDIESITQRLLMNSTIQQAITFKPARLTWDIAPNTSNPVIPLRSLSDEQLMELSTNMQLSLSVTEMRAIMHYYTAQN